MEELRSRKISLEELKTHDKEGDLWVSIHGKVYDVTEWLHKHPGGDLPILNLGGQDVTDAFIAYHPGSVWKHLDQFFIGFLIDYQVSEISKDYRELLGDLKKAGMFQNYLSDYVLTVLFMVAMMGACIVGVVFYEGFWVHVGCGIILGLVWIQSAFIGHDSGHSELVGHKKIDKFIQLFAGNGLTGIGMGWWKRSHNVHHISCNSLDFDPDLQYVPLFAVSSGYFGNLHSYYYDKQMNFDGLARFLVSYQHWTFYPTMAVARVLLFMQSIVLHFSGNRVPNKGLDIAGLLFFWTWFPLLVSCLPSWPERTAFVLSSFAVSGIQHVQFCLNHFSAESYVGRPCSESWIEDQARGTIDIQCDSWMDWFHGGLQFQVEHHMFPRLPRYNLRKISPLVKSFCAKHRLPYTMVTFWEANVRTVATLRAAALEARDPSQTTHKNLLWEALNTVG